jgi:hypothetical protein
MICRAAFYRGALALVIGGGVGSCSQTWAQSAPPVGSLQMPLVSPQQADQYFATRVVPPSDVPAAAPLAAAQPLQQLNVDPVLGHELPSDGATAMGVPRADFAAAKPGGEQKKSALGDQITVRARAPSTAVIHEQPPVIGKP